MHSRRQLLSVAILILAATPSLAAPVQVRTQNFLVHAPDAQIAQQFGQMAEKYRKQKALDWLGREMEPWPQPCPLHVKPTMGSGGGATKFDYRNGTYVVLSMEIEGSLERMLNSVLPHEVTHTVFAHHFRYPVPRWADEGGAVFSEDDLERGKHDQLCRQRLNAQQKLPLRRLFNLHEYHEVSDVLIIYAEGFSVTSYLIGLSDRATFLNFVGMGMRGGWDRALQTYYNLQTVEQLEEAWLQHLRATKDVARQPGGMNGTNVAANPATRAPGTSMNREVVRLTAPPSQPLLDPAGPIVRGQSGDEQRGRAGTATGAPHGVIPLGPMPSGSPTPPPAPKRPTPPPVVLGLPEFAPTQQVSPLRPSGPSPVGFQN